MKAKRLLIVCLALVMVATLIAAVACDDHTHEYTEWGKDATQHWKVCPDDGEVDASTKADHSYGADGKCECGAEKPADPHQHSYTVWDHNADQHWKKCATEGAIDESSKANHSYGADGKCVCGAEQSVVTPDPDCKCEECGDDCECKDCDGEDCTCHEGEEPEHECDNKCEECGKCLTEDCDHKACEEKCLGHGSEEPESEWVEFTGEFDPDPYGYSYMDPIVWIKLDVNGVDATLTYKVKDDSTVYTAEADPAQNDGTKLYYILSDFGRKYSEPRILVEVSADHNTLTIYDPSSKEQIGTLTVGGGTVEPGPVDPPVGESKSIVFGHGSNAPAGVPDSFPELESGIVGQEVTIPEITYDIAHYTFNGWNVYKLVNGDWESDSEFSRIANGGSFTMPNYAIKLVSNFTVSYVTIKFDSNGGSGTMADITGTYRYNSTYSVNGTKFQNKFTGPDGAEFLYWSTKADGSYQVQNGDRLTEEYGVTSDDILVLYAIWKTNTVTPEPDPDTEQNITDFVGKWDTELDSGNHTITIIAQSGAYDLVGYAVLDGKTFLTIYLEGKSLVAFNTDYEYVSIYKFALADGTFTLTVYDADDHYEAAYQFSLKADVPSVSESDFLGKWKRSDTQKVLIEEDGVAYYTNQGIKDVSWMLVGEYLVFSYTASNDFEYYYILTKSTDGMQGYFLAPDAQEVAVTFTANGFYTLKINGEFVEFVNAGSKPSAIDEPTAPSGQKFDGWVLEGSETPFSFDEVMTADASIVAKFVDDTQEPEPENAYVGDLTFASKSGTKIQITKIVLDEDAKTAVITYSLNDAEFVTSNPLKMGSSTLSWAPGGNATAYYTMEGIPGISFNIAVYSDGTILLCDSSDDGEIKAGNTYVVYVAGSATFTKGGGTSDPNPGTGDEDYSKNIADYVGTWNVDGTLYFDDETWDKILLSEEYINLHSKEYDWNGEKRLNIDTSGEYLVITFTGASMKGTITFTSLNSFTIEITDALGRNGVTGKFTRAE